MVWFSSLCSKEGSNGLPSWIKTLVSIATNVALSPRVKCLFLDAGLMQLYSRQKHYKEDPEWMVAGDAYTWETLCYTDIIKWT